MTDQPNGAPPQGPPVSRVIFEYNHETQAAGFRTEGNFPFPHLINVMEVAKAQFIMAQLQQMTQRRGPPPRGGLCMPDGSPPPPR